MKKSSYTTKGIMMATIILVSFITFSTLDPMDWYASKSQTNEVEEMYDQLVAFEPRVSNKSVLAFENGSCGFEQTSKLRSALGGNKGRFFGIPQGRGVYTEYINLLYVKYFEKVICNDQTYYRARLDVNSRSQSCNYLKKLKGCGTDLMERRIYRKMVNRLEALGLGSVGDFKPRRTVKLDNCNCDY